MNNIFDSIWI